MVAEYSLRTGRCSASTSDKNETNMFESPYQKGKRFAVLGCMIARKSGDSKRNPEKIVCFLGIMKIQEASGVNFK